MINDYGDDEERRAFYANDWGTTIPKNICKQRIAEIDKKHTRNSNNNYTSNNNYISNNNNKTEELNKFEHCKCNSKTDNSSDVLITIEEAIKHAKEKAHELGNSTCAKEHLQLAKWLQELLKLRTYFNKNLDRCFPMFVAQCMQARLINVRIYNMREDIAREAIYDAKEIIKQLKGIILC